MRNKFILLLILLLGPALHATCAGQEAGAEGAKLINTAPGRGTLYRVRFQNHTSYLFGTIHVGKPEFFPLEEQAMQALTKADTLALELDMRDTAALQNAVKKYGMYPEGDGLDKHLSAAQLGQLNQTLTQLGLPYASIAQMKPWMVANVLLVFGLERQGYHTALATETFLLHTAEAQGKAIESLESADLQLSLFAGMTEKQQAQYLFENLGDLQSGETTKKTQELIDAWTGADQKAFEAMLVEAQNDKSTTGKFFLMELLDKRNPAMASKIEALLKRDKASFVGIGLLHLIGRNGVPQLLSRHGYEVTRLY